jgi:hypothetical protein
LVDVRFKHHSFISEKSISTKENIDNLKKKTRR